MVIVINSELASYSSSIDARCVGVREVQLTVEELRPHIQY